MIWRHDFVRNAEPLSNHTSFRIGGPAEFYAEPSTMEELADLIKSSHHLGVPVTVLGGGTNCLVADRGVRGLVLHLGRAFRLVKVLPDEEEIDPSMLPTHARVQCGASVVTQRLVALAGEHGWADLEMLAGLPGQIGGAVVMNAQNIGQFVERVTLVSSKGDMEYLTREQLTFKYRYTALKPGIITEVLFRFPKVDSSVAQERIRRALSYRNDTQELRLPSAGCAFKNPAGQSAGRLIDEAGLKGVRIGDAQVSFRHANFIVNRGQATCDDVLSLMEHIQRRVAQRSKLWLEPEVRMIGEPIGL